MTDATNSHSCASTLHERGADDGDRRQTGSHRRSLEWLVVAALFVLALAARVFVAVELPPWQSPDEPKHFESVRMLRDLRGTLFVERRLTNLADASPAFQAQVIDSMSRHHYWSYFHRAAPIPLPGTFYDIWQSEAAQLHRHSVYYFVAAAALFPCELLRDDNIDTQLLVVRFVSAILSALTVPVTYLTARQVEPDDLFVPIVSAAFVAAQPMHIYIGGAANTDNMVTLAGALFALTVAVALSRGITFRDLGLVTLALVFAVASKRSGFALTPVFLSVGLVWFVRLRGLALAVTSAFFISVFGLVFSVVVAPTGPVGARLGSVLGAISSYYLNFPDQAAQLVRVAAVGSPETAQLVSGHLVWFFNSFWGMFGWWTIPLSGDLYRALAMISVLCAIHVVPPCVDLARLHFINGDHTSGTRLVTILAFAFAILSTTVLAEGERLAYDSAGAIPQGRYLFVVITPIAVLFAIGVRTLLPRRDVGFALATIVWALALVVLTVGVYCGYFVPNFVTMVIE